jgi:hypothetical protein
MIDFFFKKKADDRLIDPAGIAELLRASQATSLVTRQQRGRGQHREFSFLACLDRILFRQQ